MADKKIITDELLKLQTEKVLQVIADNVYQEEEYLDQEIDGMFDATPQEISYYESLINPDVVSENRLWSSKTIDEKLASAILEANKYTDQASTRNLTTEIVSSTADVTKENVLYLILSDASNNTYEQYMLIGGTAAALGSTQVDLSNIYNKSEVDTKLDVKANKSEVLSMDSVQATTGSETNDTVYTSKLTKDELDKKVNVTDIVDNLTSTDTDKPLSANQGKVLKSEVDLKANDDEVVKKTDISTTIDSTSTDDTVPTSKAVWDKLKIFDRAESHNNIITNALLVDVSSSNGINNRDGIVNATSSHQIPTDLSLGYREVYWISVGNIALRITGLDINNKPSTWINTLYGNATSHNWSGWYKVTTTAVSMKS